MNSPTGCSCLDTSLINRFDHDLEGYGTDVVFIGIFGLKGIGGAPRSAYWLVAESATGKAMIQRIPYRVLGLRR